MNTPIEYLNGISVQRGEVIRKELNVHNYEDMLNLFPYRHIDKTKFNPIGSLNPQMEYAYLKGVVIRKEEVGTGRSRRLLVKIQDDSGVLEAVWFQGIHWVSKLINVNTVYTMFGRLGFFMGSPQLSHPEIEVATTGEPAPRAYLEPVYPSTEKLKAKGLGGALFGKFVKEIFEKIKPADLPEFLPEELLQRFRMPGRFDAYRMIHFPADSQEFEQALRRLKFEEFFVAQLRMQLIKMQRHRFSRGVVFSKVGDYFNEFYADNLPFELTGAQKRVLKEIRTDTASGKQMNRLLQGDVGSGKTIVALLAMLLAADNGYQSVIMAPTEILARQHYDSIAALLQNMNVEVALLTGSTKAKERKPMLAKVADGSIKILIGTHAVIEDPVVFENLGLTVIDEQHKFGVAQRAKLQKKNNIPPHVLVMTATPIPRTLALTAYGDLDYSVMDELPPGRKPVQTFHKYEHERISVMKFVKQELAKGRQAYFIYPLIEESEKMDYENLMKGYEEVKSNFPEPQYKVSMVHGRQTPEEKDTNMQRFVSHNTQIMVSTTVIEVGVNVPNASVMVIESTEKFGLSQLHQLRGRVGRGSEASFCILVTGRKLSNDAFQRIGIMADTNDGFKIAEKDLELRGPGEIDGTRQSGALNFKLASIVKDKNMLEVAKSEVEKILEEDPGLDSEQYAKLKQYLQLQKAKTAWSKIA